MKRIVIILSLASVVCLPIIGCKTQTPVQIATKVSGGIVVTVDTGMQAWAAYVKSGNATQAQVDAVKTAYNAYYVAALADEAALSYAVTSTNTMDLTLVNSSLSSAENALLALLNQYLTGK